MSRSCRMFENTTEYKIFPRICMATIILSLLFILAWRYQQLPMDECQWCHRMAHLNRHHVIPQATAPELKDVKTNLVVLCRDCHFVLGHKCNYRKYNPAVMEIITKYTNTLENTRDE